MPSPYPAADHQTSYQHWNHLIALLYEQLAAENISFFRSIYPHRVVALVGSVRFSPNGVSPNVHIVITYSFPSPRILFQQPPTADIFGNLKLSHEHSH